MGFSFSWAGLNVPRVESRNQATLDNLNKDAANLGKAARGWQNSIYDEEYAGMAEGRNGALKRMDEISAQIARLERRNAEIRQQLQGMQARPVAPMVQQQPVQQPVVQSKMSDYVPYHLADVDM